MFAQNSEEFRAIPGYSLVVAVADGAHGQPRAFQPRIECRKRNLQICRRSARISVPRVEDIELMPQILRDTRPVAYTADLARSAILGRSQSNRIA